MKEADGPFYDDDLDTVRQKEKPYSLDRHLLSPSEKAFYLLADIALPLFKKCRMTPNQITVLSFVCGLLGSFFLFRGIISIFIVFLYISYWLDCVDGQFARRYGPYTKFGDRLDHFTDWVSFCILIFVFITRYSHQMNLKYYAVSAIFFTLFGINFICTTKLDGKKYVFNSICKFFPIKNRHYLSLIVRYLRHMDTAMLTHLIAISVIVFEI